MTPTSQGTGAELVVPDRRTAPPGGGGRCPYPGLAPFGVEDAAWFHGRGALTSRLADRLVARLSGPSLLLVVGASGAGKSSLLDAGLISAVRAGLPGAPESRSWPVVRLTPGARPMLQLAAQLAAAAGTSAAQVEADLREDPARITAVVRQALAGRADGGSPPERLLLVVDQLEELFAPSVEAGEPERFVGALCAAASGASGESPAAVVVLGLRADFYARCTAIAELVPLIEGGGQVVVGPMSAAELRDAIELPAKAADLTLQPGLVETILDEVGGREPGGGDPGRLPMLAHALRATWGQRRGHELDLAGYHAAGRVAGAIRTTADRLYDHVTEAERRCARWLLLRMVVVGENPGEDVRRRVSRKELLAEAQGADYLTVGVVLRALADERLVTVTEGELEITHDALLRAWPRLRSWLDEERDWLASRRRLEDAAAGWRASGRDPGGLLDGYRLGQVLERVHDGRRTDVPPLVAEFLSASEWRAARQRRSGRRRWRGLAAVGAAVAVVVGLSGAFAVRSAGQQAAADGLRRTAESGQLAAEADALRATDPATAALLGAEAYRIAPTEAARSSLLGARSPYYVALATRGMGPVNGVAVSPDGRTVAGGGQEGGIELWDVASRAAPSVLRDAASPVYAVAFGPDGTTVAAGRQDGVLELWDVGTGASATIPASGQYAVNAVTFSPDGRLVVAGGDDGVVRLWTTRTHALVRELRGSGGPIEGLAYSPDGRTVAAAGASPAVALWDAASGAPLTGLATAATGVGALRSIAFSPDGRTLAGGGDGGSVVLWDTASRGVRGVLAGPAGQVIHGVAFSPDGAFVAAGGGRGAVRLSSAAGPGSPLLLPGPTSDVLGLAFGRDGTLVSAQANSTIGLWTLGGSSVLAAGAAADGVAVAALSRDGRLLATAGADRTVRLWSLDRGVAPAMLSPVRVAAAPPQSGQDPGFGMAFSPDGRMLAGPAAAGGVWLWNTVAQAPLPALPGGPVDTVAFSRDGQLLAAGARDGTVQLWRLPPGQVVAAGSHPLGAANAVAFSPDGRTLAAGTGDGPILLSDGRTGADRGALTGHVRSVEAIAFSPDGRTLASAGDDGVVRLWDVTARRQVGQLGVGAAAPVGVAFSPDGRTLATSSADRTVQLWSVPSGTLQAMLDGTRDASTVVFGSATTLLAADRLGRAVAWNVDPARALADICAGGPALTLAEWRRYVPADQPYRPVCPGA